MASNNEVDLRDLALLTIATMEASPAPRGTPTPSTANAVNRNSMAHPSGVGAGAPVRNYLNNSVAGYIKRAMLAVWDAKPQYPLTWVGEYLISCDIKYNNAPATEAQKQFLYHSEGIKSPEDTATATAPADQSSPASTTTHVPNLDGTADSKTASTTVPATTTATATDTTEVKDEPEADGAGQQEQQQQQANQVNGISPAEDDAEMADAD